MDKITTPFDVDITVEETDPLDTLELNGPGAQLVFVRKRKDGFKKVTVVLSLENVEQLRSDLEYFLNTKTMEKN